MKGNFVSCGYCHTVIIDLNCNVWVFGYNGFGQLGLGDNHFRYIPTQIYDLKGRVVECGSNHTVIIDLDSNVRLFGCWNQYQQVGFGNCHIFCQELQKQIMNFKIWKVGCGYGHTVMIGGKYPELPQS